MIGCTRVRAGRRSARPALGRSEEPERRPPSTTGYVPAGHPDQSGGGRNRRGARPVYAGAPIRPGSTAGGSPQPACPASFAQRRAGQEDRRMSARSRRSPSPSPSPSCRPHRPSPARGRRRPSHSRPMAPTMSAPPTRTTPRSASSTRPRTRSRRPSRRGTPTTGHSATGTSMSTRRSPRRTAPSWLRWRGLSAVDEDDRHGGDAGPSLRAHPTRRARPDGEGRSACTANVLAMYR